jgi:hypothetical protein
MAANQAEVDLVVSAAGALPDLERQLSQILRIAENDADAIDVPVAINTRDAVRDLGVQLEVAANAAEGRLDGIEVGVLINQRDALRTLDRQLTRLVDDASRGITASDPVTIQAVLDGPESIRSMRTDLQQVVASVQATAPDIEIDVEIDQNVDNDINRLELGLEKVGRTALVSARGMGNLTKGVAGLSLAVGSALPAVAGLVAALQQVAPAAAVGTQAMLAQKLVAGTLKLAMVGVADAVERVFDPELSPDEFHKSLEGLAPEAAKFVDQLHTMRRELTALQQGVQNRVFKDFDEILVSLSAKAGPALTRALNSTADSLNRMAKNTANAANQLADQGVLGQALKGATQGLINLEKVPARVARSFGFLSAAAAPAFNRITLAIDELSLKVATKLQRAFESGALERAIDRSVAAISQLFTVLGNFGTGIGNIFSGLTQSGGGLFDILEKVSEAFERLTASKEFQSILNELALTADVLLAALLPLIEEAFKQLGPVIETLAPVVRDFVAAIGPELIPIIQQLGPILVDIALIMKEQLPLAIELTRGAIGLLSAALTAVSFVMHNVLLPAARAIARFFETTLGGVLSVLPRIFSKAFDVIASLFGDFEGETSGTTTFVKGALSDLGDAFKGALVDAVRFAVDSIKQLFRDLGNAILGAVEGLVGDMAQLGRDIMSGLASGLTSGIGRIIGIAQSIADSVTSTISGALDIRSPSRVMAKIGADTTQGYIEGLESRLPGVERAAVAMARIVPVLTTVGGPGSTGVGNPILSGPLPQISQQNRDQRVTNIFLGGRLIEQLLDDRIQVKMNQDVRVRSQGVRI